MAPIEVRIDELYKGSLAGFIRERAALAKTLTGKDALRVRGLRKPLLVPWVINQVYWHARPIYERLEQSGEKLRTAQVAALGGREADVRGATRTHRDSVAAAVAEGIRMATVAGLRPDGEQLARTLEALSLASRHAEAPGRLTRPLTPAGFEALGGVAVKPPATTSTPKAPPNAGPSAAKETRLAEKAGEQQAVILRREQAALQKAQAALRMAEAEVDRARTAEALAREKWEQTKRHLDRTERALGSLHRV